VWLLLDFWKICAPLVWVILEIGVPFSQIDVCVERHGGFSERKMSLWRDEHLFVQGDQKVSMHLTITVQKTRKNLYVFGLECRIGA
jgi:hypothetical protein